MAAACLNGLNVWSMSPSSPAKFRSNARLKLFAFWAAVVVLVSLSCLKMVSMPLRMWLYASSMWCLSSGVRSMVL